jgi:hypothetical protein
MASANTSTQQELQDQFLSIVRKSQETDREEERRVVEECESM